MELILFLGFVVLVGVGVAASWPKKVPKLEGKTLAVFGIRGVGKTVLLDYLTKGILSRGYTPSGFSERTKSLTFRLKDIEIKLEESTDVPGASYIDWESVFKKADIVIYLVRTPILLKQENDLSKDEKQEIKTIETDLSSINRWRKEESNTKKKYFILGTHCDLIPGFDQDKTFVSYETKFRGLQIIRTKAAGMIPIIGSLIDKNQADKLIYNVVKQV